MPMSRTAALLFLLPALLLGACGQTTPVAAPPLPVVAPAPAPAPAPVASTLSLRVFIPGVISGQSVRPQSINPQPVHPQYVSAATTSLRVQLGSFDTTLALSSAACVATPSGQSCTFNLNVSAGEAQTLTVSAYDAASRLLGTSTSTVTVVQGQDNSMALTLTGVAASASVTVQGRAADVTTGAEGRLLLDLGGSYSLGTALKDAAGQLILNPGRPTETLSSSNSSFAVSETGGGTFSLMAPDPSGSDQTTTLSVRDALGALLATQTLTVPAQQALLSLSTSAPVAGSSLLATARLTSARGRPLSVLGRRVTFSASSGSFANSETSAETASTDAAGMVSVSLYTGSISGTGSTVTLSSDGAVASASYTSVAGAANTTTSSVSLSPASVKVGGASTLTVTLKDRNNNPVTTVPGVTVNGGAILGTAAHSGNVFTYAVTAASAPGTTSFTVSSGGNPVGSANLLTTTCPFTLSDGGVALVSGTQYDFRNGSAHTFAVGDTGCTGAFSARSSNTAVATVSVNGGVLSVTPGSTAGYSTIAVTDSSGQKFPFDVSVTTASLTIN